MSALKISRCFGREALSWISRAAAKKEGQHKGNFSLCSIILGLTLTRYTPPSGLMRSLHRGYFINILLFCKKFGIERMRNLRDISAAFFPETC